MRVLFVVDGETKTALSGELLKNIRAVIAEKGHQMEEIEVTDTCVRRCTGCFGCWLKTPGECVINDTAGKINRLSVGADYMIYFGPVIFGQYDSAVKNMLDRGIHSSLPFFTKAGGRITHPARYAQNPKKIFIGYGEDITDAEKDTFTRIVGSRNNRDTACIAVSAADHTAILQKINVLM